MLKTMSVLVALLLSADEGAFGMALPRAGARFDLGADIRTGSALRASVTWFYERFHDELVTQSPGANLQNFTFNAPGSRHQGVEMTADWYPAPARIAGAHVMLAYTYDDQRYTDYVERLSAGTFSVAFDRAGNRIPGVPPHYLNLRAAYNQPSGVLEGLGGFVELNGRDGAFMDNANLTKVPSYRLVNRQRGAGQVLIVGATRY